MFSDISECGTVYTFIKELKKYLGISNMLKNPLVDKGVRVWPSSMIGVRLDEGSKPDQS